MSQRHASALVSVMFGLLLSFLLHLQGTAMKHFTRLLVNLTTLMAVVLLFLEKALDEHIRLDKETAALEKEKKHLALKQQRATQCVCIGDFKAARPWRFHTPHHACCLLSLRLLQQLLLWMLSRTSSPSSTILAGAAVPAATEVEAVKYALATSGQSARGGFVCLITRAAG